MDLNDLEIYHRDTVVNVSVPAMLARQPCGSFIRGPVWLCALQCENTPCADGTSSSSLWTMTPEFVMHGVGWNVPSWVFERRYHPHIMKYSPHTVPDEGQRHYAQRQRQNRSTANAQRRRPCEGAGLNKETTESKCASRYVPILPRPAKSAPPSLGNAETQRQWIQKKQQWLRESAKLLVNPKDQWNMDKPLYYNFKFNDAGQCSQ